MLDKPVNGTDSDNYTVNPNEWDYYWGNHSDWWWNNDTFDDDGNNEWIYGNDTIDDDWWNYDDD